MQANQADSTGPWWKFPHVWMIVAGPAIVVVAAFVTLYLAVSRPDPLVSNDYYKEGIEINKALRERNANTTSGTLEPAQKARNHAQTEGLARPAMRPADD